MIKEICSPDFSSGPQIAAIGILLGLCDKRCRPWVFVSFGPSQKKEPLGGDEPRQDSKEGLLNAFRQAQDNVPVNARLKDLSATVEMTDW